MIRLCAPRGIAAGRLREMAVFFMCQMVSAACLAYSPGVEKRPSKIVLPASRRQVTHAELYKNNAIKTDDNIIVSAALANRLKRAHILMSRLILNL